MRSSIRLARSACCVRVSRALSLGPNPHGPGRMRRRVGPIFTLPSSPGGCLTSLRAMAAEQVSEGLGCALPGAWWLARFPCETLSLDAIHRAGALLVSDGSMSGRSPATWPRARRCRHECVPPFRHPIQDRILAGIEGLNDLWVAVRP
jgi:hypothetical protein